MSGRNTKAKAGPAKKALGIITALVLVAVAAYFGPVSGGDGGVEQRETAAPAANANDASIGVSAREKALRDAIRTERSGVMVEITAKVMRVLPDDNEGSRHQRFLLELDEPVGDVRTILVAHNIDLAERVPLDEGDRITVSGQYEWNEKGGVIHWTHHDPGDRREGGWIEHRGVRYE